MNIGDLPKTQPFKESTTDIKKKVTDSSSNNAESAAKYTNISKPVDDTGDAYRRESTVASVSRIGLNREKGSQISVASPESRPVTSDIIKKNFGNI